jgi:4-amino-4-deoxychorismate lyase
MVDQVSLINGQFSADLPITDRGLAYGDGLFETLAIRQGRPCRWLAHLDRLARGAARLRIPLPSPKRLHQEAKRLLDGIDQGRLKIILTRGSGGHGYAPPVPPTPTRILIASLEPAPSRSLTSTVSSLPPARVRLCESRLGINPRLAGLKHLNRLEQVLARAEWEGSDIDEGLMLDAEGALVCGTRTNLFLFDGTALRTPRLDRCGVAGTAREVVLDAARQAGIELINCRLGLEDLARTPAAFLTNALVGIWPIGAIDGATLDPSCLPGPLLEAAHAEILKPESDW